MTRWRRSVLLAPLPSSERANSDMACITLRSEHRGLDECLACFASASEASAHAHCALIELDFADGAIRFQGSALVSMEMGLEGNVVIGEVKPIAEMILFEAGFMSVVPRRERVAGRQSGKRVGGG